MRRYGGLASIITAIAGATATMPAAAAWQRATSQHFIVYDNAPPAEVRMLTERLERYNAAMRTMWNMEDRPVTPATRVTLFMVADGDELHRLMGKGSENVGGYFRPAAGQPTAFMPRYFANDTLGFTRAVMFHEYAHYIMSTGWGHQVMPGWLREGFAEYHATVRFQPDGSLVFGAQPRYRQYTIGHTSLMPVSRLISTSPNLSDAMTGDAFYARAWLLTDYLIMTPGGRKLFVDYMDALNKDGPTEKTNAKLGNPRQLEQAMDAWARQPSVPTKLVSADKLKVGEIKVEPLSASEAAIMPALLASTDGVDETTAPRVAALARRLAAPYPNDAFVQNELAEAEFDTKDYAASRAAADRAVAADPRSIHAMLYQGRAAIAQLKKDKVQDAARWTDARRPLLAANKVDPEDPRPLIDYYESFADAKQAPTANAQAGLLYAQALAPFDFDTRYTAGKVLLAQGKGPEARAMLQPIAANPHQRKTGDKVVKAMAKLESEGPAPTLAFLEQEDEKEKVKRNAGKDDAD